MEAKQTEREIYTKIIDSVKKEDIVYVDESGIDPTNYKNRGWGQKGKVLLGKTTGKRFRRTNIVAGLNNKEIIAPMTFQGSCNTVLFTEWIKQMLIPALKVGQVVVMDNASFHKSPKIRALIESAGCKLIYLPTYSPDLNPIEKFWANLKRWINQHLPFMRDTHKAISFFFKNQAISM